MATRQTNNPVTRGYRVYWGESEDEDGNVINEINFLHTFGYEETKDLDGPLRRQQHRAHPRRDLRHEVQTHATRVLDR